MKQNILNPTISVNPAILLDEIMWPAARYCIGRQTYVSDYATTYARIIQANRDKFNAERLLFFAGDIRENISRCVHWHKNVDVTGDSNNCIKMDAYSLIAGWLESNPDKRFCDFDFDVDCAKCEVKAYPREEPLHEWENPKERVVMLQSCDLIYWIMLANLIDESTHVKVTTDFNGEIKEHICIPYPESFQIYDEKEHTTVDYNYQTVYKPITRLGSASVLASEYIVKVEPLKA